MALAEFKLVLKFSVLIGFSLISSLLRSGEPSELTPRTFAKSVAEARKQIVSYRVAIEVRSRTEFEAGNARQAESVDQYYFEFSRLEDHFVCAKAKPIQGDWFVVGQSDGVRLTCSGTKLAHCKNAPIKPDYFDPLACGLMHCEQFTKYWSFDDELQQISTLEGPTYFVEKLSNETLVLSEPSAGRKLVVDTKRGFWPVANEQIDSFNSPILKRSGQDKIEKTLTQELTKVKDLYLPKVTNMSCYYDKNRGKQRIKMTFDWIDVNSPIPIGMNAVNAIAERLKLEVSEIGEK